MSSNLPLGGLILAVIGLFVALIGLCLAISTTGRRIFWALIYWVIGLYPSYYGRGDRLTWDDLAQIDKLHSCKFPLCHSSIHVPGQQCWSGLLSDQFSSTWDQRMLLAIRKPIDVRLRASFIKTDTRVLFAFMLLSAPERGGLSSWYVSTEVTQNGLEYTFKLGTLEFRLWQDNPNGPFLGHLEGPSRGCKRLLTRHECEKMLSEGCHAWYRSAVPFGPSRLSFPDWSDDHDHGGWIALVGLSEIVPMPIYMRDSHWSGRSRWDYRSACGYVLTIVRDWIRPRVVGDDVTLTVDNAIEALHYMYSQNSASGLTSVIINTDLHLVQVPRKYTSHLSKAQGDEIVKLFSSRDNFTSENIPEMLVKPAVAAAVRGVWKVYKYLQDESYGLGADVRQFLNQQRIVYLVDCRQFDTDKQKKEN